MKKTDSKFLFKTIPCPLCGISKFNILGTKRGGYYQNANTTAPAQVVRCPSCSLIYANPMPFPNQTDFSNMYNEEYTEMLSKSIPFDQLTEKDVDFFEGRLRLERLEKILGFKGRILDIGCGPGNLVAQAVRRGWDAVGLEVNLESARFARDVNKVNVVVGRIEDYCEKWCQSFDAVYFNQVLEHTPDPLVFLKIVRRILKNRGVIFCGVPNENSLMNQAAYYYFKFRSSQFVPFLSPTFSPYHIIGFSHTTIQQTLEKTSFDVIDIQHINYTTIGSVFLNKEGFFVRARNLLGLMAKMLGQGFGLDVYGIPR